VGRGHDGISIQSDNYYISILYYSLFIYSCKYSSLHSDNYYIRIFIYFAIYLQSQVVFNTSRMTIECIHTAPLIPIKTDVTIHKKVTHP
jgi:hypothetical protein